MIDGNEISFALFSFQRICTLAYLTDYSRHPHTGRMAGSSLFRTYFKYPYAYRPTNSQNTIYPYQHHDVWTSFLGSECHSRLSFDVYCSRSPNRSLGISGIFFQRIYHPHHINILYTIAHQRHDGADDFYKYSPYCQRTVEKHMNTTPTIEKEKKKRIVCIGGGTGTFVSLKGLKKYNQHLSAIVSMSDSGGSNKRIRDEFGLLPTSDLRQCIVALSDENGGVGILRKLFMYRFEKGQGISGMTFGNLFMAALTDIVGSQKDAIEQTSKILRIKGSVIPVSYTDTNLVATYADGTVEKEEHFIDEPRHDGTIKITNITLSPPAEANGKAVEEILKADLIVLGPGDLYTSILPNLVIDGIKKALNKTKGKIVYVLNLMTKYGQTYNFTAYDHVKTMEQYIGPCIDTILINTRPIPRYALSVYAKYHELPVLDDLKESHGYTVLRADLISDQVVKKSNTDTLVRSLIRHDSDKLGEALMACIKEI